MERKVNDPAIVYCDGRLFRLKPEQWQRLRPLIKGLTGYRKFAAGFRFLVKEGVIHA